MANRRKSHSNLIRMVILLLVVIAGAGLAACDSTGGAPSSQAPVPTTAAGIDMTDTSVAAATIAPSDASGQQAATPSSGQASGGGTAVQATLREWAIDLSQAEVPAGTVRFTVTNAGQMEHNFTVIDSSGQVLGQTPTFPASAGPQTLSLDLNAGTYTVICSLPGHAARGQKAELTVK